MNDRPTTPPSTEAEILSVTVGERKPINARIYLADYDPDWPLRFDQLAADIRRVLGDQAELLEHVGSTSVPYLAAKPIIDIVLAVPDSSAEFDYVPALTDLGYELRIREPDWFQHRVLKLRDVNLHVFTSGCEEIAAMLQFRDWLRSQPGDRQRYEDEKRRLANQVWKYTQNYADAKSEIVQAIKARAQQAQA